MGASYDEELTPHIDPPVIDPPPPVTLLRRIFAHWAPPATVVEAPLVPVAAPARAAEPPAPGSPPEAVDRPAPEEVAARYCPTCRDRVAVAADGLHCGAGHRLSPAHARRRRWAFGRRR